MKVEKKEILTVGRPAGTVIFSIHQPRYSIFKLFDQVLFLASGSNIYVGSPLDVLPYFASLGFTCEEHDNPADFVLDLLIQSNTHQLHDAYRQSSSTIVHSIEDEQTTRPDLDKDSSSEFYYLARRTLRNVVRNPALLTSQVFSVIIYGLFTGLIFHRLEQTVEPGVYNRFGAIFFIISCQVLTSMSALETLIKERALFIHVNRDTSNEEVTDLCRSRRMPVATIVCRVSFWLNCSSMFRWFICFLR